ncbi:hypothetical protein [Thiomonas delicata]|jgi:hypothetical protein|uniref:Uncharacterized protein n=1 Tax=Thiomonas delicata TaxID=364030 RepID=A0A238D2J7_THIDL|nr:hypothetical protein [Thiomonas delicata]SBP87507.1 conserved hypothetical protein [Thiomonas delicata]
MTQNEDKPEAPDDTGAFDRDAALQQLKQTQAELREIARRKRETAQARARAEEASNPRQFALNSLMAIEDELFALFDSDEKPAEILAYLKKCMPSIPADDLRHALDAIRKRRGRFDLRAPSPVPATPKARPAPARPPSASPMVKRPAAKTPTAASAPPTARGLEGLELPPWADGSDRLPEESEADYILRKNLEGPPEARRKFIGEHNA